jgi:hypothetical protein
MIKYIIIKFSDDNINMLEENQDLSIFKRYNNIVKVSTRPYFKYKKRIDFAIKQFVDRLIEEYGYARAIGIQNVQWAETGVLEGIEYIIEVNDSGMTTL